MWEKITMEDVKEEYEEHPTATPMEHVYNLLETESEDEDTNEE